MLFKKRYLCISLLLTALTPLCAFAKSKSMQDPMPFSSGFYGGASLDYNHLGGNQNGTGDFTSPGAGVLSVPDKRVFSDDSIGGTIHAGYLYRFEDTDFVVALEPYFGFSSLKDKVNITVNADAAGDNQTLTFELKRKFNYGLPLKWGFVLADDYMLYLITGLDLARFEHRVSLKKVSDGSLEQAGKRTKTIPGFTLGLGFERQWDEYRIGLEIKNTRYRKTFKNNFNTVETAETNTKIRPSVMTVALKAAYVF